ncbi:hypothetical protein RR48_00686 [Papilio machaon]|uniref:Uncharacterized protein n=1 Tax=Papilio machaon TaxID=76193 RepID=A0A0N0PFP5_PAPMA|nr:hypothetical protein RR48_00686 [Papilio machaon]
MDDTHKTLDLMNQEAIEFGEWVSRVAVPALLAGRLSDAGAGQAARMNMETIPIVTLVGDD